MYRTVVALALAKNVFGFQVIWHPKAAATDGDDEPQWKAKQIGGGWYPELKEDSSAAAKSGHWDAGKWVKSKAGGSQGFHDANGKWHQAGSTPGHHDADGNWVAASDGEDSLNEVEDMSSGDGANGFGGKTKEEYESEHDVCIGACCQMGHEKLNKVPEVAIKLIMTDGCSGSTAVMEIVEQLHQAANMSYAECHAKREVFDDINAGNYNIKHLSGNKEISPPDTVVDMFGALVNHTISFGVPLFVKEQSDYLLKDDKLRRFVKQHGKVGIFMRANLFDLALCDIKDGIGAGQDLGNCTNCHSFRSRGDAEEDGEDKVTFDANNLLKGLHLMTAEQDERVKFYVENFAPTWAVAQAGDLENESSLVENLDLDAGERPQFAFAKGDSDADKKLNLKVVTAEDLFAFEYSEAGLSISVRAWTNLLKEIGSRIPYNIIFQFLKSRAATRPPPKTHNDMIDNLDEIKEVIKVCGDGQDVNGATVTFDQKWCDGLYSMLRF